MDARKIFGSSSMELQCVLSLEQEKIVNLEQEQGEIKNQLVQIIKTLQQLVWIKPKISLNNK